MRLTVAWCGLLALAGCPAREPEVGGSAVPVALEIGPRRSCRATAAPYKVQLSRPGPVATIGGRDFVYFWRRSGSDVEVVLASLDARGELVVTPVPVPYAPSVAIGADADGLVLVWAELKAQGTLLRVALAEDGSLRPGAPVAMPAIAWGWPAKITSDGAQATLVHTLATEQQSAGATVQYAIDLASAQVVTTTPMSGEEQVCDAGGCTTIVMTRASDGGGPGRLRVAGPGGEATVEVDSACPAHYVIEAAGERVIVAPGAPWRAIAASSTRVEEVKVELASDAKCGHAMYDFPMPARPGVLEGLRERWLIRWDPVQRAFGRREALPDPGYDRTVRAGHVDGVIEVGWKGWSGMAHDPEHDPEGQRIYFAHWSFEGGVVKLLRPTEDRWDAVDAVTLPLADVRGTFHDGYTPVILRNGVHAAVLLAPGGSPEETWAVPYLRPC
jgi:hypothetical protein